MRKKSGSRGTTVDTVSIKRPASVSAISFIITSLLHHASKDRKPKVKGIKVPAKKTRKQIPDPSSSSSDTEQVRESGVDEASEAQDIVIPPRSSPPPPDVIVAATAASGPTPSTSTSPQDVTQQKKQKQKQQKQDQELEFLQANTFLYNMKSKDYKDKVLRAQVWLTHADKIGLDGNLKKIQLSLMYTCM